MRISMKTIYVDQQLLYSFLIRGTILDNGDVLEAGVWALLPFLCVINRVGESLTGCSHFLLWQERVLGGGKLLFQAQIRGGKESSSLMGLLVRRPTCSRPLFMPVSRRRSSFPTAAGWLRPALPTEPVRVPRRRGLHFSIFSAEIMFHMKYRKANIYFGLLNYSYYFYFKQLYHEH